MFVHFNQAFKKRYKKFHNKKRKLFEEKLKLFINNPFDPILNNHPLKGEYKGCRSINIGGDMRAIYILPEKDIVLFTALGTHDELYL